MNLQLVLQLVIIVAMLAVGLGVGIPLWLEDKRDSLRDELLARAKEAGSTDEVLEIMRDAESASRKLKGGDYTDLLYLLRQRRSYFANVDKANQYIISQHAHLTQGFEDREVGDLERSRSLLVDFHQVLNGKGKWIFDGTVVSLDDCDSRAGWFINALQGLVLSHFGELIEEALDGDDQAYDQAVALYGELSANGWIASKLAEVGLDEQWEAMILHHDQLRHALPKSKYLGRQ